MDAHTRQQLWEKVGREIIAAADWGATGASWLTPDVQYTADERGRYASIGIERAAHHANRALDLLDQLRSE